MFDSVMDSIGDSLDGLFDLSNVGKAAAKSVGSSTKTNAYGIANGTASVINLLDKGATKLPTTDQVALKQGEPAQSADYQAINDAWVARLAKYAGIANASAVKLGGL